MTLLKPRTAVVLFILSFICPFSTKAINNQNPNSSIIFDDYSNVPEITGRIRNSNIKSSIYISMGKTYNKTGSFAKAINCFNYALKTASQQNDSSKLIPIYNLFAYSLNSLNRYTEGFFYSDKAKHLLIKYPNPEELIKLHINLAAYYCSIKDTKLAFKHLHNAIKILDKKHNNILESEILQALGELHFSSNNLVTAAQNFRQALTILEQQDDINHYKTSNLYYNIGNYYNYLNNKDSALFYYNKALYLSEEYNFKDRTSQTLLALSKLYINFKDTVKAYEYLNQHNTIQKELFHSTMSQQISQLYVQFNSQNKDNEILIQKAKIKSQRLVRLLLITLLLSIILISTIITVNYYRLKLLNSTLKKRNKEIVSQNKYIREKSSKLELANQKLLTSQQRIKKQKQKLEETNQKYIKANSSKDKFFDIIAHDLRSPFQSILGFSTLLYEGYEDLEDSKRKNYIKLIETSTKRVCTLIEDLLSWSRSQNDRLSLVKTRFCLNEVISDKIDLYKLALLKKQITISTTIPDNTTIYGDKNMIKLAIRNIINNAIKFSNPGSRIEIFSTLKDSKTTISIKDYGIGMDKKTMENLFSLEKSIKTTGTIGEKGTGLGLIICKEYIEKNEGLISVESSIGKGSAFHITLPQKENISILN